MVSKSNGQLLSYRPHIWPTPVKLHLLNKSPPILTKIYLNELFRHILTHFIANWSNLLSHIQRKAYYLKKHDLYYTRGACLSVTRSRENSTVISPCAEGGKCGVLRCVAVIMLKAVNKTNLRQLVRLYIVVRVFSPVHTLYKYCYSFLMSFIECTWLSNLACFANGLI